ncbi:integrase catalytic domain-containing protein [Trichonephila clavata]|uniref:Integrase catalytic domain-containing protein n=1 Tax=Trichonephila clavata TaxID=2740835 RepID=A0A8X6HTE8_TRICU|nr:integrase catalytic domain-containing protein [Trichonephila clavata]
MYRQILVEASQRDLQHILWKVVPEEEIVTYRLKTVTYGMSNAPFLAVRTLQQLAQDGKTRFPLASEALLNDTYTDDIVSGAPDIETARRLQSELQDALQSCGMVLHKWSSNSPELLNSSSSSDVEHSFSAESDLSVKTLGISWKPLQDCFVFKVSILSKSSFTKREVLSVIARLYDPLGFLGPVLTKAKVLLQRLWQQKLDWDDVLPDQIAKEWKEFVTTFKVLKRHVLRFLNNLKQSVILSGSLNASELDLAETKLIRMAQREIFSAEFRNLHDHKIILPNSKIKILNPFLDGDGILRVGGRLENSDLPYVAKYPAILPSNHKLTNIIIMYFHKKNLHLGASSLLHCVIQKYWPLHGRSLCRKIMHECVVCFRAKPIATTQLMGNLPRGRVVPDYPFNCSGVDFCGPFMIRYRNQRKGVLHICMFCL